MNQLSLVLNVDESPTMTGVPRGTPAQCQRISGSVEKVSYFNEETGQCVLDIKLGPARGAPHIFVAGTTAHVYAGQEVDVDYIPLDDVSGPIHAERLFLHEPSQPRTLKKFLKSGALPDLGPHLAAVLSTHLAGSFFSTLEHEPQKLLEISGVGRKRQQQILSAWFEFRSRSEVEEYLFEEALPLTWAKPLWNAHRSEATEYLRSQPYRTVTEFGFSFELIDSFSLRHGFRIDSTERLRCGVLDLLREHYRQGHCAFPESLIAQQATERLGASRETIENIIELELVDEHLVADTIADTPCLYLREVWDLERTVAEKLRTFQVKEPPWGWVNLEKSLSWAQNLLNIRLAGSQKNAIEKALSNSLTVITGGPGTGKTTLIRSLVTILQTQFAHFALCSPTGRAAHRLAEATGVPAQTIHRLLKFSALTGQFTHHKENPLNFDLVLIDEASMVDLSLMASLLDALPARCALILVGDADQIPSVGAGSILQSIIGSQKFGVVTLTDIFRQSEHSLIKVNAQRINQGLMPLANANGKKDFHYIPVRGTDEALRVVQDLFTRVIPQECGISDPRQLQILVPLNRGALGTHQLNETLQTYLENRRVGSGPVRPGLRASEFGQNFRGGDKVMVVKNDYQKDVFNGDIGFIQKINYSFQTMDVEFDDRVVQFGFDELDRLTLAYTISIHKSQGSEYRAVIVVITQEHLPMAQRHLIYTAVTRGKEHVFLVADPVALLRAVQSDDRRWQKLTELLRAA